MALLTTSLPSTVHWMHLHERHLKQCMWVLVASGTTAITKGYWKSFEREGDDYLSKEANWAAEWRSIALKQGAQVGTSSTAVFKLASAQIVCLQQSWTVFLNWSPLPPISNWREEKALNLLNTILFKCKVCRSVETCRSSSAESASKFVASVHKWSRLITRLRLRGREKKCFWYWSCLASSVSVWDESFLNHICNVLVPG